MGVNGSAVAIGLHHTAAISNDCTGAEPLVDISVSSRQGNDRQFHRCD